MDQRRRRTAGRAASRLAAFIVAETITAVLASCTSPVVKQPPAPATQPGAEVPRQPPQPGQPTGRVEILWDTWGIPHVFARDEVALFWAFGWAQMESHGDLLLRLYGQARGRAAEYWGERYVDSDRWVRVNGIPRRAQAWVDRQTPYMRIWLDAFAEGINAFARTYPERIDDEAAAVLPVTSADVLAHVQRVIHYTFVTSAAGVEGTIRDWQRPAGPPDAGDRTVTLPSRGPDADLLISASAPALGGSNGWAIAPARTRRGGALLLANPHLPWGDLFTWYEAHLVGPGLDAYGAALVGFPLPGIAFNEHLGWTHTVNTIDAADLYELTLEGDGYAWDGRVRNFETERLRLRVRQPDGTLRDEPLEVHRSIHGPVVARRGNRALALRVAGLDEPGLTDQTWSMLRARNLGQFEAALANLAIPMFTVIYADRDGHILHVFNGRVPVRDRGDTRYWAGVVPGDTSATLWTAVHPYPEMPRLLDPVTGWLQNANDPPWTTTLPIALRPEDYPPYMAPGVRLGFRPQRSARMLAEDTAITFEELQAYKHSTRVEAADHVLEDLVIAAYAHGSDRARRAARVLEAWDRSTDADSRGAVLFQAFFREFSRRRWPRGPYDVAWQPTYPLSTPDGLSDPAGAAALLEEAAARTEADYGALNIAWGDVYRLRRDQLDLPANGGPGAMGVFRVIGFDDSDDGRATATSGDSFVAAVEFGPTLRARALLSYGNASQSGSPHRTDQLPLLARKQLRTVWLTRADVEAHLEKREVY